MTERRELEPCSPLAGFTRYHLDNWTDDDFKAHIPAIRKALSQAIDARTPPEGYVLVPVEPDKDVLVAGIVAFVMKAIEIDGPAVPLPKDRQPTLDEMSEYCIRAGKCVVSGIEMRAAYAAMLAAASEKE